MRVGVLSDTHDRVTRTQRAVCLLQAQGAEALIHCGDLTGPRIVAVCAELRYYFVFGNRDADAVPELQRAAQETGAVCLGWGGDIVLAGKRIAIVHGHLRADVRRLLAAHPDFLFFGHTHIPLAQRDGSTVRVNPGALDRADRFTVALVDLQTERVEFLAALP